MLLAKCPTAPDEEGHMKFSTTAHVAEEWQVDKHGNFLVNMGNTQVVQGPRKENIWYCCECGEEAIVTET
jgi:hypothetical protein